MLTQSEIKSLGWTNKKRFIDDIYEITSPELRYNRGLRFSSWRLAYGRKDHSVRIVGFEYENFHPEEEVLFSGDCPNKETLELIMKLVNIL